MRLRRRGSGPWDIAPDDEAMVDIANYSNEALAQPEQHNDETSVDAAAASVDDDTEAAQPKVTETEAILPIQGWAPLAFNSS